MPGSKRPQWLIPLLVLLSVILLAVLWLAVRLLAEADQISAGLKIGGITAAAIGCLLLAAAWLWPVIRQRRKKQPLGTLSILIIAYIMPVLALIVPLRLAALFLPSADVLELNASWLRPGPPWLLLIQGGILAVALVPYISHEVGNIRTAPTRWIYSLFAGLGIWLLSAFAFSLLARNAGPAVLPEPLPPPGLLAVTLVSALIILPLGEELFFRKLLPETVLSISPKLISTQSRILLWVISAAIFASVQVRPLLWLPAFFLGIGLSALAEHNGRLRESILAHALFNLLALALNWATIL